MTKPITIVIVNWNGGELFRMCLESIAKHHDGVVEKVVVVDNDSSDGSSETAEKFHLPGVDYRLIRNRSNRGFAAACNQGGALASSPYVLFLNPDAAVRAASLGSIIAFMEAPEHRAVGVCGVQLYDEEGRLHRSCGRFPGLGTYVALNLGVSHLFPRLSHFMAEWPHTETREVDQVIGAFFLCAGMYICASTGSMSDSSSILKNSTFRVA